MKRTSFALISTLVLALAGACGDDDTPAEDPDAADVPDDPDAGDVPGPDAGDEPAETIEVNADITEDTTWEGQNTYVLKTHIFVEGATLTIEAGTLIQGDSGSSLVITKTATIDAVGTAADPIVFTSSRAVGQREPGDWGGVILLGSAGINVAGGTESIEGFAAGDPRTEFGGDDNAHDCGTIKFARIEFTGFELSPDNELQSLTVGGCGTGTDLDYIQSHKSADDGVEFFGGSAGIKHLLITQPDDDGLDWDLGWTGKVQFLIVQQNNLVGENAFESDNNGNDHEATPVSRPVIWNVTLVGSDADPGTAGKTQRIAVLREGTAGEMNNLIAVHFADFPIDVRDASTAMEADAGRLFAKNSIFFDNGSQGSWDDVEDNDGGFNEGEFFGGEPTNHLDADPELGDALDLEAPDFAPGDGSPALDADNAGTPGAGFDATATYIGAIGTDDWTADWTAYPLD